NDPAYVEAARGLAQRVMKEDLDLQMRLTLAFRHTLARQPKATELALLEKTYQSQYESFKSEPANTEAFLKVGELKIPEKMNLPELAAMTAVANVLLNLNETITR